MLTVAISAGNDMKAWPLHRSVGEKYFVMKGSIIMDDLFEKELSELGDDLNLDDMNLDDLGMPSEETPKPTPSKSTEIVQEQLGAALNVIDTYVDIVFCIDVTGSMAPLINTVKNMALDLYDDLITDMREKNNRAVKKLRVKVIAFRDYYCDGSFAMDSSEFFTLPDQNMEFRRFVESLEAKGGGDEPENALEAMALAMRSDWQRVTDLNTERSRHVVAIFTDASAHPLEKARDGAGEYYPTDMLKDYKSLYQAWQLQQTGLATAESAYAMDSRAKRLILFAPEAYPWSEMAEDFENTVYTVTTHDNGGKEISRDTIIAAISGSMA